MIFRGLGAMVHMLLVHFFTEIRHSLQAAWCMRILLVSRYRFHQPDTYRNVLFSIQSNSVLLASSGAVLFLSNWCGFVIIYCMFKATDMLVH